MKQIFILFIISILFFACVENGYSGNTEDEKTTTTIFVENFDGNNPKNLENFNYGSGGNKAEWATKIEGKILKMAMDPADKPTPWQGQNYSAKSINHFGRYSARIKIPSVETQPNVGGVVGFYTYYNDLYNNELPKDENENGLSDNSEIDFEWLIANPQVIYLTAWTDHEEESGEFRNVSRIINLATGKIYTTNYSELLGGSGTKLSGDENQPSNIAAIPDFDASKNFYTYGFDWKSDCIRWWIINPENSSDTITLWNYKGPKERITQKQAYLSFNIWHTNDWSAQDKPKSTEAPTDTFWAEFDWIKYEKFDYPE